MWLEDSMNMIWVGFDVVVVQHQFIFQWNIQWNHLYWCGTFFSGAWSYSAIGSTLRFGEVWFSTLGTRGVSPTILGNGWVNFSTIVNWLPCCFSWVFDGCIAHLKFSNRFLMEVSAGSSTFNISFGVGFLRSWINFDASIAAAYFEEVLDLSKWWGEKSTMSEVLSAWVVFMQHVKHMYYNGDMPMYHPPDPWGEYVSLFSVFSWTKILVTSGENFVRLNLKIPNSCSWADRFGLILDLRISFIVVIALSSSLSHICNGKYGLTLHNPAIKWFLDFHIARSDEFFWFIFGGTNLKSIFLSWRLWIRMLEDSLSSFWYHKAYFW